MKLPSYLGICPNCKARVALNARACAGCGRTLAPGEAKRSATREGLYGYDSPEEPVAGEREGGISSGAPAGE